MFKKKNKNVIPRTQEKAICPMCKSLIIEKGDFWICNNNCGFKIKNILDGEKIDIDILINIQNLTKYNEMINYIKVRSK